MDEDSETDAKRFDDELEALFTEATALASELRKRSALVHREDKLPAGTGSMLLILEQLGPQTVPSIARIRARSRQNIQILANHLQARGLVASAANPAHKRSRLVHLTDRGRSSLAVVMEREAQAREALLPHVSEGRLIPAARLLRQLRGLLAGHELPPTELAGRRPTDRDALTVSKPARRKRAAPVPAAPPPSPEGSEAGEGEFPINLL